MVQSQCLTDLHHLEPIRNWRTADLNTSNSSLNNNSLHHHQELPVSPKSSDVLFGKSNFRHPGNVTFRSLCADRVHDYLQASARMSKGRIAQEIVDAVAKNGGRFLRKLNEKDKSRHALWIQVDNKTAQTKAAHTLRDAISNRNKCVMNMHVQQQQHMKQFSVSSPPSQVTSKPVISKTNMLHKAHNNHQHQLPNNLPPSFINISLDASTFGNSGPVTFPPRDLLESLDHSNQYSHGSCSSTSSSSGSSSGNFLNEVVEEQEEASLGFMDTSPVKTEVLQEDLISLGDGSLESTDSLFDEGKLDQMNLY